jgi:hypothetical protein
MNYFLGGYYLIKLRPVNFGSIKSNLIKTCSNCINDSLLHNWSYSWATDKDEDLQELGKIFQIDNTNLPAIREWVDEKYEEKKIGWGDLFFDLQTALTYKQKFFSHLNDVQTLAIYFNEQAAKDLLKEFEPVNEKLGSIGLYQKLKDGVLETDAELFLGYDIIGIENSGDFHTFHCHDLADDLEKKFNISVNQYGLYDSIPDFKAISDYMNNEDNGFEPVPWFVVKVKQVIG